MPLQNRVTPFGEIIAHQARGSFMGNRGGRIHDRESLSLLKRRWSSRQWICCALEFKNRQRVPMQTGYTELFFLDEVTALAAGHRPCFECRRKDAEAFLEGHRQAMGLERRLSAQAFDRAVHEARLDGRQQRTYLCPFSKLADGTMVAIDGEAYAIRGNMLLRWQPHGYVSAIPRRETGNVAVLTPAIFAGILSRHYKPSWHASADKFSQQ